MRKIRLTALWMERLACAGIIITSLVMYFAQCPVTVILALDILFFILLVASAVISLLFWRCRGCGKGFPIKYGIVDKGRICPYCGKLIE